MTTATRDYSYELQLMTNGTLANELAWLTRETTRLNLRMADFANWAAHLESDGWDATEVRQDLADMHERKQRLVRQACMIRHERVRRHK